MLAKNQLYDFFSFVTKSKSGNSSSALSKSQSLSESKIILNDTLAKGNHSTELSGYHFFENKNQKHSGELYGKLYSKFYFDKNNVLKYDDINAHSDGYFNNAFIGNWTMYNSKISKIAEQHNIPIEMVRQFIAANMAAGNISKINLWDNHYTPPEKADTHSEENMIASFFGKLRRKFGF